MTDTLDQELIKKLLAKSSETKSKDNEIKSEDISDTIIEFIKDKGFGKEIDTNLKNLDFKTILDNEQFELSPETKKEIAEKLLNDFKNIQPKELTYVLKSSTMKTNNANVIKVKNPEEIKKRKKARKEAGNEILTALSENLGSYKVSLEQSLAKNITEVQVQQNKETEKVIQNENKDQTVETPKVIQNPTKEQVNIEDQNKPKTKEDLIKNFKSAINSAKRGGDQGNTTSASSVAQAIIDIIKNDKNNLLKDTDIIDILEKNKNTESILADIKNYLSKKNTEELSNDKKTIVNRIFNGLDASVKITKAVQSGESKDIEKENKAKTEAMIYINRLVDQINKYKENNPDLYKNFDKVNEFAKTLSTNIESISNNKEHNDNYKKSVAKAIKDSFGIEVDIEKFKKAGDVSIDGIMNATKRQYAEVQKDNPEFYAKGIVEKMDNFIADFTKKSSKDVEFNELAKITKKLSQYPKEIMEKDSEKAFKMLDDCFNVKLDKGKFKEIKADELKGVFDKFTEYKKNLKEKKNAKQNDLIEEIRKQHGDVKLPEIKISIRDLSEIEKILKDPKNANNTKENIEKIFTQIDRVQRTKKLLEQKDVPDEIKKDLNFEKYLITHAKEIEKLEEFNKANDNKKFIEEIEKIKSKYEEKANKNVKDFFEVFNKEEDNEITVGSVTTVQDQKETIEREIVLTTSFSILDEDGNVKSYTIDSTQSAEEISNIFKDEKDIEKKVELAKYLQKVITGKSFGDFNENDFFSSTIDNKKISEKISELGKEAGVDFGTASVLLTSTDEKQHVAVCEFGDENERDNYNSYTEIELTNGKTLVLRNINDKKFKDQNLDEIRKATNTGNDLVACEIDENGNEVIIDLKKKYPKIVIDYSNSLTKGSQEKEMDSQEKEEHQQEKEEGQQEKEPLGDNAKEEDEENTRSNSNFSYISEDGKISVTEESKEELIGKNKKLANLQKSLKAKQQKLDEVKEKYSKQWKDYNEKESELRKEIQGLLNIKKTIKTIDSKNNDIKNLIEDLDGLKKVKEEEKKKEVSEKIKNFLKSNGVKDENISILLDKKPKEIKNYLNKIISNNKSAKREILIKASEYKIPSIHNTYGLEIELLDRISKSENAYKKLTGNFIKDDGEIAHYNTKKVSTKEKIEKESQAKENKIEKDMKKAQKKFDLKLEEVYKEDKMDELIKDSTSASLNILGGIGSGNGAKKATDVPTQKSKTKEGQQIGK